MTDMDHDPDISSLFLEVYKKDLERRASILKEKKK